MSAVQPKSIQHVLKNSKRFATDNPNSRAINDIIIQVIALNGCQLFSLQTKKVFFVMTDGLLVRFTK